MAGPRVAAASRLTPRPSRFDHGRPSATDYIPSSVALTTPLSTTAGPPRPGAKTRLWSPESGIRFSPSPSPSPNPSPGPSYPALDVSRFFQTTSRGAEAGFASSKEGLDVPGAQVNKDGPNRESAELSTKSARPSRILSPAAGSMSQHLTTALDSAPNTMQSSSKAQFETQSIRNGTVEPPSTSLSFNISPDLFYAARSAKAGSSNSFWSYTMYQRRSAAGVTEKVKVHYCTSKQTMEWVCKEHFLHQEVIGFDLEWLAFATRNSGARENVSLIQVSSPDRIGLFHVALFSQKEDDLASPTFRKIMEDPNVSKVGVNIRADFTRLKKYLGVTAKGIFELSHLYKQVKFTEAKTPKLINKTVVALSTQVQEVLRLPMFKGDVVRSSNWMRRLNHRQILYSASDAYAGIQLYHVLETRRKTLHPCPERPHHSELGLPIPVVRPETEPEVEDADEPSDDSYDAGTDSQSKPSQMTPATPPQRSASRLALNQRRDYRIMAAEEKVAQYRASKNVVSVQPAALRAYHLWYDNLDLSPEAIARILRDPPLQTNTVVSYILDAIVVGKLPHDQERLRLELIPLLHQRRRMGPRYGALVRSCEQNAIQSRT
ncbi:hypothetical protein C2857_005523 [Epichloe festucae Fl1]|uniref:3'-5' exonuclease domain-containing protein n=1 Tax=Epichloe festucae (strain Fl1) TaxID=877507 RepID=A0A7S9KPS7_EPIFF|nr:hypothetical protein C2857_005523 [Epichloe festucae Fl1]